MTHICTLIWSIENRGEKKAKTELLANIEIFISCRGRLIIVLREVTRGLWREGKWDGGSRAWLTDVNVGRLSFKYIYSAAGYT